MRMGGRAGRGCHWLTVMVVLGVGLLAGSAHAQDVPKPVDEPYSGLIELQVDATDVEQ